MMIYTFTERLTGLLGCFSVAESTRLKVCGTQVTTPDFQLGEETYLQAKAD